MNLPLDAFDSPCQGVRKSPVTATDATTTEGKMEIDLMEVHWIDTECTEDTHPRHSVWRRATVGKCTLGMCKTRMEYDAPWLASASISGPFTGVDVHRATEAEALADILDLARRCGMIE